MSQSKRQRPELAQRPVADLARILQDRSGEVVDESLLSRALTHRSFAYENGGIPHNERQEFLGDAVLGVIVTDHLYREHPDLPEGQLAKFRAAVVNSLALAKVARQLDLGAFLKLGRGEATTGGRDKDSILADTMEAVIGTVYLSSGIPGATALIHSLMDTLIEQSATLGAGLDWKTSLQEISSSLGLGVPAYRVEEEGPDHDKTFTATVLISQENLGHGVGRNKKSAEQQAAEAAWKTLNARAGAATDDSTAGPDRASNSASSAGSA
ncbi:ribonuclease 3 [Flexivirga endophytica]|uniref:Ribonuclease 3 n=1 Tax=Flexivirga endophytica TaxID=1849103 RepID=A0A916TDK2_9MICO|nr:ribonuclease III [Flexivirga endophytica]GGB39908.1 ribonuclease 3 [Flexivirga endophytica]GHB47800.1 ribonuclease 3 [Flexivirga endophytica]